MGASYELSATVREKVGKGAARSVRRQDQIPAVIYGGNQPPIAISLPARELTFKINGGGFYTTVATIAVNGEKIRALPRDFQIDPMTERPIHVDFLRVAPGSTVTVEVPVQFVNDTQSPGIRRGGVLNVVRHRVELIVPVDNIPEKILADLTGLDINDSLHISAIPLPEGVRATIARDFTIATIAAPAGVKEEMRALAEAAAAAKAAALAAEEAGVVPAAEGAAGAPAEGAAPAGDVKAAPGAAPAAKGAAPAAKAAAPAGKGGKKE
ncbi:MAG: 50S ribosomal protein L25/general stress protein Ctc [Bauldia sp.]|nr:50S ribosomal protein L25/general stress protein Ctc [Bauldia sp.]